jgi:hypothetical protein
MNYTKEKKRKKKMEGRNYFVETVRGGSVVSLPTAPAL